MRIRSRLVLPLAALLAAAAALSGCSAASPASEASTGAPAEDHVVTTDYGDVTVPGEPQRVVVLNFALSGYLFNLDVPVTATTSQATNVEPAFAPAWADAAEAAGTEWVPWSSDGFDLEAILALEPDLIVGGGVGFPLKLAEDVYSELSDIAPTVLVGRQLTEWEDQFSFLADVFQERSVYDRAIADYDARVEEVAAAITPPPAPASFVSVDSDGEAFGLVETKGLPTEFQAVGIETSQLFATGQFEVYGPGEDAFPLSTEQVGQVLTQPTVFVTGFNSDTTSVEQLRQNAVWAALPAFQSGNAHYLPYWTLRGDYDDAMATLDLIEEMFGTAE